MLRATTHILMLCAFAAGTRLIPHVPNMTAVSAVGMKAYERYGLWGVGVPLGTLFLTDIVIGFYSWQLMLGVYLSFALVSMLGPLLTRSTMVRTASVASLGSVLFFLITNTCVWALSSWYPHTASGLLACLLAGLPFLGSMLFGDILYGTTLFKGHAILTVLKRVFASSAATKKQLQLS